MAGLIANISDVQPSKVRIRNLRLSERRHIENLTSNFLKMYGLKLASATKECLIPVASNPHVKVGILQNDLRYALTLLHAVGAVSVYASGLGLGKNDQHKRMVDRSAAGIHGVGLNEILKNYGDTMGVVAAAEGERIKPGEAGGNPARFRGEIFGSEDLIWDIGKTKRKPKNQIYIISDDVDGTGKACEREHNSVTAGLYTQSQVKPLPDEYMVKLVSSKKLPDHLLPDSDPQEIVEIFSKIHGIPYEKLNFFCLLRPRHESLMKKIVEQGPNFIYDRDGDVMPAISAAVAQYVFDNGYPLHGIVANVGGAAEAGLIAPIIWRGGSAVLQFASKSGLKSKRWEDRNKFIEKEVQSIKGFGLDHRQKINLENLFDDPFADGVAAYGAITDVDWMDPYAPANTGLIGVKFGLEGVSAHALSISSTGLAEILHFIFEYTQDRQTTENLLTPYLTNLLALNSRSEVEDFVDKQFSENPNRLKTEFAQEYYTVLNFRDGRMELDHSIYQAIRNDNTIKRFGVVDDMIIDVIKKKMPDWFI